MRLLLPAIAALALAACGDRGANTNGENGLEPDADGLVDPSAADPATTDLNMDASPTAVDQAINQTDQQSDLDNVADDAANSVGNTVE